MTDSFDTKYLESFLSDEIYKKPQTLQKSDKTKSYSKMSNDTVSNDKMSYDTLFNDESLFDETKTSIHDIIADKNEEIKTELVFYNVDSLYKKPSTSTSRTYSASITTLADMEFEYHKDC